MKFNIPQPSLREQQEELRIGNVYKCKGGGKTAYWIVVGLSETSVNLLGINSEGAVSSTANYGVHVFTSSNFNRVLLGRCNGLDNLEFDIEWIEQQFS